MSWGVLAVKLVILPIMSALIVLVLVKSGSSGWIFTNGQPSWGPTGQVVACKGYCPR